MCGECSQCMNHTGFVPAHSSVYFLGLQCSGSRVLCRAWSKADPVFHALPRSKTLRFMFQILHKGTDLVGHVFCALPRSELLRRPGAGRVRCPTWRCVLITSPLGLLGSRVCQKSTISGVPCVSSGKLISGCDPPGRCQPSRIPGRCG